MKAHVLYDSTLIFLCSMAVYRYESGRCCILLSFFINFFCHFTFPGFPFTFILGETVYYTISDCSQELTRELQQCRKRLEIYETSSGSNSLGQGSRASSCNSLNTIDGSIVSNKIVEQNSPSNSNTNQVSRKHLCLRSLSQRKKNSILKMKL